MITIKVRTNNGDFIPIVKSLSLKFAKRQVLDKVTNDLDLMFGDYEIFEGRKRIAVGKYVKKRIHWIEENKG